MRNGKSAVLRLTSFPTSNVKPGKSSVDSPGSILRPALTGPAESLLASSSGFDVGRSWPGALLAEDCGAKMASALVERLAAAAAANAADAQSGRRQQDNAGDHTRMDPERRRASPDMPGAERAPQRRVLPQTARCPRVDDAWHCSATDCRPLY